MPFFSSPKLGGNHTPKYNWFILQHFLFSKKFYLCLFFELFQILNRNIETVHYMYFIICKLSK